MDLFLKNKKVFITASTDGIGKATAKQFLDEGAIVVINGRDKDKMNSLIAEWRTIYGEKRIYGFGGDMSDVNEVEKVYNQFQQLFMDIDILVGNLGTGKPIGTDKLNIFEWEHMMRFNLFSAVDLIRIFAPLFSEKDGGSIVLMSSLAAFERIGAPPAYAAAKSGIVSFIEYMALELAEKSIRINGIAPGNIYYEGGRWDELEKKDKQGTWHYIEQEVPMKRFGTVSEIAASIVFLASSRSSFTTGAVLKADGGQSKSV